MKRVDTLISSLDKQGFLFEYEAYVKQWVESFDGELKDALAYTMLDGGKRIRPLLVFYGAKLTGKKVALSDVLPCALAICLVHNYSLVHDDLPAMDNDEYRRGKLTVHKRFGEANAILTGDLLLTLAGEVATSCFANNPAKFTKDKAKAFKDIFESAKLMIFGQVKDLAMPTSEEGYIEMYAQKTGALFQGAVCAGWCIAGGSANGKQYEALKNYGRNLGISFQLIDDVLDEGEQNSLFALVGRDRARELIENYTKAAITDVCEFKNDSELVKMVFDLLKIQK